MEIEITLANLHPGQQKVRNEASRFNVLCCGRRWGKSALAVDLIADAVLDGQPVGYFTPTYKLLDGTYRECLSTLSPIISRKNEHQFIEFATGGRVEFWSLENELAGRSRKYKRVIVDEAAFTRELWKIWTESIRATLTDLKGDGWFMSTPKGKNDFYKLFQRGKSGEEKWQSWQMSTYTNPYIDPEEIDDARRDLPELAFSQEYMAEFNDNVANPFGLQFIQQCTYPLSKGEPVCFGIDLAKSFDWTVIIGLDKSGAVCYFDRFQKPWPETTREILNLPNKPILIDSTGAGDPIADELQSRRAGLVTGFKFTSWSKQQIMEGLALAIQQRKISFPEGHITSELSDFEYIYTATGVKYSAPQGLHDDCVCALALAWEQFKTTGTGGVSWI